MDPLSFQAERLMGPKLYRAATAGDVDVLRDINTELLRFVAPHGYTVLHIAARFGHAQFVDRVLKLCSDLLTERNSKDDTPLHSAARTGQLAVVKILIERTRGSSSNLEDGNGLLRMVNNNENTALHEAAENGHFLVAIELFKASPGLVDRVNKNMESPLHLAARYGRYGLELQQLFMEVLTRSNISMEDKKRLVRMQDQWNRTALHYAALGDMKEIGMVLVQTDVQLPYLLDDEGRSPLHIAAAAGSKLVVQLLLENFPDTIEQLDRNDRNALHIAAINGKPNVVRGLVRKLKGLVNSGDGEGNTPLHLAVKSHDSFSFTFLLKETKLTVMNKDGLTVLDLVEREEENEFQMTMQRSLRSRGAARGRNLQVLKGEGEQLQGSSKTFREEERMGATTNSFVVVAALITTVSFAAGTTIPGGYDPHGTPVLVDRFAFCLFVVLNSVALILSVGAIICFIARAMRRYMSMAGTPYWGSFLTGLATWAMLGAFVSCIHAVFGRAAITLTTIGIFMCVFLYFFLNESVRVVGEFVSHVKQR